MSCYMKYIVSCNTKSYQTYCVMSNDTKSNMLHYTILIHINCIAFCSITFCCMISIMSRKHTLYHVTSISYHIHIIYSYSSSFFKYTKFLKHQQKSWHSFIFLARYFSQEFSNLGEAINQPIPEINGWFRWNVPPWNGPFFCGKMRFFQEGFFSSNFARFDYINLPMVGWCFGVFQVGGWRYNFTICLVRLLMATKHPAKNTSRGYGSLSHYLQGFCSEPSTECWNVCSFIDNHMNMFMDKYNTT